MATHCPLRSPSVRSFAGAAALLLLCLMPAHALAQGDVESGPKDIAREEIAKEQQIARQKLIDHIRASDPSLTDAEITDLIRKRWNSTTWLPRPSQLAGHKGKPFGSFQTAGHHSLIHLAEPSHPAAQNAFVVTGTHLTGGKEVLMISSLADLARTGTLQPRVSTQTGNREILEKELGSMPPGRVYYEGDPLDTVDLEAVCDKFGHELIHRSPQAPRDFADTDRRVRVIADRPFEEEELTVVDGLPQDAAAVHAMGLLAGRPEDWLDFHREVRASLRGRAAHHITTQEAFFRELSEGQRDLLILVAHSTGSQLYLNGRKTSINELQALPARTEKPPRPRLAVLIACDAGKVGNADPLARLQALGVRQELSPLAKILIDKGFVDKVLAPNHKIDAAESLTVLRRALEGGRTKSIFSDWVSWAVARFRTLEPLG